MKYLSEEFSEFINNNCLAITVGFLAGSVLTYVLSKKSTGQKPKKDFPKNVVIIHGFGRGPYCPSLCAFCLRTETYLRMNKIPYQCAGDLKEGHIPWTEYNGEVVQYFQRPLITNVDRILTNEESAISRAFQVLLEDLKWCVGLSRWVYGYTDNSWTGANWLVRKTTGFSFAAKARSAGIGKLPQSEVERIFEEDMKALSDFLGKKDFMLGSKPTDIDSVAFGILAQILWHSPRQPCEKWINEKYPNLKAFCLRMKDLFWEDWDECITHGGTREATR
ncbi:hypothetical protein SNE40_006250 [Patella caerulea]|uniref:Failed axon connections homolog n=1 Tax=Patella caerulea TaxID=87958 RepID=A0AAN8K0L7_PATCE